MRKTLKEVAVILLVFAACLSGCSSEHKNYKTAVSAYESHDFETAILGFQSLGDYKDSAELLDKAISEYVTQQITDMGSAITDVAAIHNLVTLCNNMNSQEFGQIVGAERFENLIYDYIDSQNQATKVQDSLSLLKEINFISEDCLERCLISCGRWGCVQSAEEYIRDSLKSPRSYYRNKGTLTTPNKNETGGYYSVKVTLDYTATNGFGGEVRNKEEILVHFTIDLDNKNVAFDCVGNTLDALSDALEKAGF